MTSNAPTEAFVWAWLPGALEPVVVGRLKEQSDRRLLFHYGRSYLNRPDAIPLDDRELPLQKGFLPLFNGLSIPGCLRDGSPDAWGRRVILNRIVGASDDTMQLNEITYMLESGSDRVGALDFQRSATEYVPRLAGPATLEDLLESADRIEQGKPLSPDLVQALQHGTSIGGARPKALIETNSEKYIAKFSSSTDIMNFVKAEFVAMRMADRLGLDVAQVRLVKAAGRDVLLIRRFDRLHTSKGWQRRLMLSALTLLQLDEMMARYASYETLCEIIRHRFGSPEATLRELFARLIFNILCGNTDDHARNHAAFWNGTTLQLTPAYDLCPQPRAGNEATQAMLIQGENRFSRLDVCIGAAAQFLLSREEAIATIDRLIFGIQEHWQAVCDEAELSEVDRRLLWRRQFLNPFAFTVSAEASKKGSFSDKLPEHWKRFL